MKGSRDGCRGLVGGRSCGPPLREGRQAGLQNGAADQLRDLRDDRVAEAMQAVHPSGNPMSHSTHVGFSEPPATSCGEGVRPSEKLTDRRFAVAVGVVSQTLPSARATAVAKPSPEAGDAPFRLCSLQTFGVGHMRAA